ncbi:MAG: SRPBCC family protein [Methylocystis sp.]
MSAHVFKFDESWDIPGASVEEVYDVLARGELLPQWWKGVYFDAERLTSGDAPEVGARLRAKVRGFLPFTLKFTIEATQLKPPCKVAVRACGDLDGAWSATLTQRGDDVHIALLFEAKIDRPGMRFLAPFPWPLFALNHYWTTPRGERGLREYLKARRSDRSPSLIQRFDIGT